DGAARHRRSLLRYAGAPASLRLVDGLGKAARRHPDAGDGRVLLHPGGIGMVRRNPVLRPLLFAATVLLAAAGFDRAAAQDIGLPVGTQVTAVTIEDLDGNPVDLGRYIGRRPVVLQFWATWCPLCEELEPSMRAVQQRYGGNVDVLV